MRIGQREIGPGHPVYVIAEIGSNHDGSLARAEHLIRAAAEAGADAAKFQFFDPDTLYPGRRTEGAIEEGWLPILDNVCKSAGIDFICSVFDLKTLDRYVGTNPVAIKIASPEAMNERLVRAASASGLPLLISTGAMDWRDVEVAQHWIVEGDFSRVNVCWLHCTSAYPAPPAELNLSVIARMRDWVEPHLVGYSDHSMNGPGVPMLAAALGASVIEKHFTTAPANPNSPDHPHSVYADDFAEMVSAIRNAAVVLGDGEKRVMSSEDATDRRPQ